MRYEIVLLFIAAVFNATFSYIVLRGARTLTTTLFSVVALAVALWSLNLAFFLLSGDLIFSVVYANAYYIAAAAIPITFFYFCRYFLDYRKPHLYDFAYSLPFLALVGAFTVNQSFLVKEVFWVSTYQKSVTLDLFNYKIYSAYFLFYVFAAYVYLLRSYRQAREDSKGRRQIALILGGTSIAYVLGMVFNLLLPAIGNYQYIWIGPIFSLIMVGSMAYAIFKLNLFNIKAALAEVALIVIFSLLLLDISFTQSLTEVIFKTLALVTISFGGILLIRGVYRDIARREQIGGLVTQLAAANKQLRLLEAQKSEFVSIASHQLRTPLTAIKGYTSMVLEGSFGNISETGKKILEKIFYASQRLVALVEDLLTISRIERGKIHYELTDVDLRQAITDVIQAKQPDLAEKGLALTSQSENPHTKYIVHGDVARLKQVIANMVENAIKYTPRGFIRIFLSRDEAMGKIRISISDTGIGMDKKTQQALFSDGKGIDDVTLDFQTRAGIGAYVAQEIIKAHHGRIWADSSGVGSGSTIFIELPDKDT